MSPATQLTEKKEVALVGNPNSGKTTLFNALTGLRQTTGNYPGVTVEKKIGQMKLTDDYVDLLDLPGTYSLLPKSPDEEVVHDVLFGNQEGVKKPDLIVMILDSSNLERNMYLLSQIVELGIPVVLALTMVDFAKEHGVEIDSKKMSEVFGIPCVELVANKGIGVSDLKAAIQSELKDNRKPNFECLTPSFPAAVAIEIEKISDGLKGMMHEQDISCVHGEAMRLLSDIDFRSSYFKEYPGSEEFRKQVESSRAELKSQDIDWSSVETEGRYSKIENFCDGVIGKKEDRKQSASEKIDYFLTHKIWGLVGLFTIMGTIFQSIFSWAGLPMDMISGVVEGLGSFAANVLPEGQLNSLVVDGIIAGVGNVVIFLPQIFLLFFFIAFLEDLGYMARAAFVLDRLMKKAGLNGKAFLPLLSSFACAIPGIMATRTIESRKDRLATILVAPLMSCSARLPVYALMIGAFIPATTIFVGLTYQGLALFSMYFLSLFAGLGMAALFRKTLLKGDKTPFIFELPPYRLPNLRTVLMTTWHRAKEFLINAGTIIFCLSIVIWFLTSYPKNDELIANYETQRITANQTLRGEALEKRIEEIQHEETGALLRDSFAGKMGLFIEPVIKPLGFDWKLGIGIVGSFAAREVLVSTLAIVYNIGADADESSVDLITALQGEKNSEGAPLYTPLTAISLMVFFVLACQCMSTVAIVKRETNTWSWPIFMILYMTVLAWVGSFVVYQGGKLLGFE